MSFIRYDHAERKGSLMATQYDSVSGWSEAKVVVEDSAEVKELVFSTILIDFSYFFYFLLDLLVQYGFR